MRESSLIVSRGTAALSWSNRHCEQTTLPHIVYILYVISRAVVIFGFQIVVVLIFAFVFNAAGALCLTLHTAPQHPGGFSRSVRSAKILSYAAGVYDILLTLLFCVRPPDRDSLRALKINEGGGAKTNLDTTQLVDEKGSGELKSPDKGHNSSRSGSPVDYWSSPDGNKGGGGQPPPLPPPMPPPPMPPPMAPSDDFLKKENDLYENLEVPPGFTPPPPPFPPPPPP
ncbi:unnamed protein product [Nippostrongylus brasiliensis]|uniref:Uncharacterized protein n=1 Tax=Nippostrongylus brasiliensis TaxID=27835 RepID=A0A3P7BYD3_NIPBR|nr:unnamed protein product [Nippostrongylus brasiliensis]